MNVTIAATLGSSMLTAILGMVGGVLLERRRTQERRHGSLRAVLAELRDNATALICSAVGGRSNRICTTIWRSEHVQLAQFLNQRDYCELLFLYSVLPGIMRATTDMHRSVEGRRRLFDAWLARYQIASRLLSGHLPRRMRFPVGGTSGRGQRSGGITRGTAEGDSSTNPCLRMKTAEWVECIATSQDHWNLVARASPLVLRDYST